eukprot:CAMPEP_0181307620 /NCGR_PEP_ID=MMETSP1101-20121128/10988_1 /TAXON_ID=46948 /ORGANISM="Rhodomonas abbreviata, Strain Caron Lab Isolate" /LENGTH=1364 /DNA_ID=CAMNT_0023413871 /DNA_START=99 /DNA_END=4193 /DNA_ORIENTATION=+
MASPGFVFAVLTILACANVVHGFGLGGITCDPDSTDTSVCHKLGFCDEDTQLCKCPPGTVYALGLGRANEADCLSQGYSIRGIFQFANNQYVWDDVINAYASALPLLPNAKETIQMQVDEDDDTIVTLNALFETRDEASTALSFSSQDFSGVGYASVIWAPDVYFFTAETSSDALQISASGLEVTNVFFDMGCLTNGCWKIDITYTTGRKEAMNVLYLPRAVDGVVAELDNRLDPSEFPCGTLSLTQSNDLSQKETSCCMLPFLEQYRVSEAFHDYVTNNWASAITWDTTSNDPAACKQMQASDFDVDNTGSGKNFVPGKIKGLTNSYVAARGVVDPNLNKRQARIVLSEEEARTLASQFEGTIGVEYSLDLWVGIAEFTPTDQRFLDSQMKQVEIHLEKSDYFTVSSFGTLNPGDSKICCGLGCVDDLRGGQYCPDDQFEVTCVDHLATNPNGIASDTDICCPYEYGTAAAENCDGEIFNCLPYYDKDGVYWVPPVFENGEISNPEYNLTIVGDGICCLQAPEDDNGSPFCEEGDGPYQDDFSELWYCDERCAQSCPPGSSECPETCSLIFWTELTRDPNDWAPGGILEGDPREAEWVKCCEIDAGWEWDTDPTLTGPPRKKKAYIKSKCFPCQLQPECRCDNSCCAEGDCPGGMIADINLRVHEILDPADRTNGEKMQYLQVTFTTGYQYEPQATGAIALSSVQVAIGDFAENSATIETTRQSCLASGGGDVWTEVQSDFLTRQASDTCTPNARFCEQIDDLSDRFVSFNVPLGIDYFEIGDDGGLLADNNIFLSFTLTLKNTATDLLTATQVKAQIPLVLGGVNSWCSEETAAADLQGVAHVDLMVGSAIVEQELDRLWMRTNLEQTNQSDVESVEVNTTSIESSIMTLVVRGDESYFTQANTGRFKLEIEDIITLHIMENDTPQRFQEILALVEQGNAFSITADAWGHHTYLDPTVALSEKCSFFPEPASRENIIPAVCVARRDIKNRVPQVVNGGVRTAMEVLARTLPDTDWTDCEDFMTDIFGSSDYAKELGREFGKLVVNKWTVNNRYIRAWWINPGYEWTPASTGGSLSRFTLSQRLIMFALVNLNEDFMSSRRMLLATANPRPDASGTSSQSLTFNVDSMQLITNVLDVDRSAVTEWSMDMGLTDEQACYSDKSLKDLLRGKLNSALKDAASPIFPVQILRMEKDMGSVRCSNRRTEESRRNLGTAVAKVSAAIIFDLEETKQGKPYIHINELEKNDVIISGSVAALDVNRDFIEVEASVIDGTETDDEGSDKGSDKKTEQVDDEDEEDGNGGSNTTILAAVLGSIGGVLVIAAVVVGVKMARARKTEEPNVNVQEAVSISELKSQIDPSLASQF